MDELKRRTRAMASADGVPNNSVIRSSWWTTFFPGNRGFPVRSSAKMHPMLQISIAGVYCEKDTTKHENLYALIVKMECEYKWMVIEHEKIHQI